jgi:hypothetical protein
VGRIQEQQVGCIQEQLGECIREQLMECIREQLAECIREQLMECIQEQLVECIQEQLELGQKRKAESEHLQDELHRREFRRVVPMGSWRRIHSFREMGQRGR